MYAVLRAKFDTDDLENGGPPGLNLDAVTVWICSELDLVPPLTLTRIGHGQSNLTYLVESKTGEHCVIRRPPLVDSAGGAHDMMREFRILTALADQPVPTPRPLGFTEGPAANGSPSYVMEYVDGVVLHTGASAENLTPSARLRASEGAVSALAALHSLDIDVVGLGNLGRRDSYAERQVRRWRRQWSETQTRDLPIVERVGDALAARVPPQHEATLVHGDFNLANLIVGVEGNVRSILDWELSTLGDPVADLGTLLCYWPDRGEDALPERDPITLMPGFANRSALVAAYASAAPHRDLSALNFWHALATWKLAIIFEGITSRSLANKANSHSNPETLLATTDHLVQMAASLIAVE